MSQKTTYKELLVTIIQSLDLINPILKNHHRRVAVIAYYLGKQYGLNSADLKLLVMSASVHDIGALTVKERDELLFLDVSNPYAHSYLGSIMIEGLPYFEDISKVILHHHIKWQFSDGIDPRIVEICSILHLADRIDVLIHPDVENDKQAKEIIRQLQPLVGYLFKPRSYDAFLECAENPEFWFDIDNMSMQTVLNFVLARDGEIPLTTELLERFAETLAKVIDFRSEFTATHSQGVSAVACAIARLDHLESDTILKIKIAGLLHDIGKMGVAVELIEKNAPLTDNEYERMKKHTSYTYEILSNLSNLEDITLWASAHHEKQDGSGYPFHLAHGEISREAVILAFADVFTALTEDRPYRKGLDLGVVIKQMKISFDSCEYPELMQLLEDNCETLNQERITAQENAKRLYEQIKNELQHYKIG